MARFAEKEALLASDDLGADLSAVEVLQRKFDLMARDMKGALATKVEQVVAEAIRLGSTQPDQAERLNQRKDQVEATWRELQERAEERRLRLEESRAFQLFLKDFRDISSWIGGVVSQAGSTELAQDLSGADDMLKAHLELESEVATRTRDVDELCAAGAELLTGQRHYADATQVSCYLLHALVMNAWFTTAGIWLGRVVSVAGCDLSNGLCSSLVPFCFCWNVVSTVKVG